MLLTVLVSIFFGVLVIVLGQYAIIKLHLDGTGKCSDCAGGQKL